jgi:hypothetical protein
VAIFWRCKIKGGYKQEKGNMTKTVEIYFDDLKPEAQEHLLMTWDTSKDDENWDTVPLAVIEREVEEP